MRGVLRKGIRKLVSRCFKLNLLPFQSRTCSVRANFAVCSERSTAPSDMAEHVWTWHLSVSLTEWTLLLPVADYCANKICSVLMLFKLVMELRLGSLLTTWSNVNDNQKIQLVLLEESNVYGNRSSRPKVISPEVMSPGTRVMSPEFLSNVARNFIECLILKRSNNRKE